MLRRITACVFRPSRLEDDLVNLHVVEKLIALDCLGQRHDLVEHETATVSLPQTEQQSLAKGPLITYLSLSWFLANTARASGNSDRTGQRPIWRRTFLL